PQPGLLFGAVVTPVAVPLVDDVVELGIQPAGDPRVAAERVNGAVVVPAPVDVARAALVSPHVAELAVDVRLTRLPVTDLEVPRRARVAAVARQPVVLLARP